MKAILFLCLLTAISTAVSRPAAQGSAPPEAPDLLNNGISGYHADSDAPSRFVNRQGSGDSHTLRRSDDSSFAVEPDTADTSSRGENRFTVGLALSGGGAAGLAHIGVLKVLEEAGIPVDVVSGTSMGAIIGALYAIGYSAEQIEEEVRRIDWRELFEEPIHRHNLPLEEKKYDGRFLLSFPVEGREVKLPTGLVSGNYIFNKLAELTATYHHVEDFRSLPRPFVCVASDLETGHQVVMDSGFLPDAIRASMSIPSVFDPVWVDGKYLVDGGLLNNMPVQEAIGLGADFVIAVNSSSDLKPADELLSLPDILTQTISVGMRGTILQQLEHADFYIQPDLAQYTTLSFGDVDEIILAGERAARSRLPEIRELADSLHALRGGSEPDIPEFEPIREIPVRQIHFDGLKTVPLDHIRTILQIEPHSTVPFTELDEGLLRLYGMKRFNRITYRLYWDEEEGAADLTIYLEEQTANMVQAGFYHNSEYGPSLLFNTTFRNLIYPASTARLNIRIGHEAMLEGEYFNYIGLEPRLSFLASAGFREREIDIYDQNRRVSNLRTDIFHADGLIGPLFASVFRTGVGYRIEHFNLTESYGEIEAPKNWNTLHMFLGEMEFDNLNRSHLPTSGQHTLIRAEVLPDFLPGDASFGRITGTWKSYLPINQRLTILQSLYAGHIFGGTPPLHYRLYAGGHNGFWGYRKDALSGNNLLTYRTAAQYQFYGNFYATGGINLGNRYENLTTDLFERTPRWGWAAILGWNTILGPIEAVLSGSKEHALLFEFLIGMNF
ncbi:patatin-like phospholipase family protein [Balneolales bacterium ANBcel1]|nr:patatin-like phospholipase family protein [Balneolales bacterium ANBcel1]